MKKRMLCLFLTAALALSLAACGAGDAPASEPPSVPTAEGSPSPTTESSPPPVSPLPEEPSPGADPSWAEEMSLPDRDYQPWQRGYVELLIQLCGESSSYSLYDVDMDGVPELFADGEKSTRCYTFLDGETVLAGEFSSKYAGLYTYPDKNGFLMGTVHDGHSEVTAYSLENGKLSEGQQLFSEDSAEKLTFAYDVVPGAETFISYSVTLVLPVCDWYDGPPATGSGDPEQAHAAILAVMEDGAPFIMASTGDRISLAEYAGGIGTEEGALPYELTACGWQDLNRDGQEECLIELTSMYESGSWGGNFFLILSEQDGEVYAYGANDSGSHCSVYSDGTLRHNSICWAIAFWKEKLYEYYPMTQKMPNENYVRYDESAQPVEWVKVGA